MIKTFLCFFAIAAGIPFFTGCTVIRELPETPASVSANPSQAAEYRLSRAILEAFLKNDAKKFISLLPEGGRERLSEKTFHTMRESIIQSVGEPISYQYVTALELPILTPHIWKIRCRRTDKKGQEHTGEILVRIITGHEDKDTPVVTGFQLI